MTLAEWDRIGLFKWFFLRGRYACIKIEEQKEESRKRIERFIKDLDEVKT